VQITIVGATAIATMKDSDKRLMFIQRQAEGKQSRGMCDRLSPI